MPATPRRRGTRAAAAVLTALALLLAACGKSDDDVPAAKAAKSTTPRARTTEAQAAAGGKLARLVAAKLYPTLSQQTSGGNVAFSPTSIANALGMLRAGASGYSANQIDAFFVTLDVADLHRSLNALGAALERRTRAKDHVEVAVADSLWGQKGTKWKDSFLDLLHREYGVGVFETDYAGDIEQSRKQIDQWVSERTKGKIPELLPSGSVAPGTNLTLVDALYLSAPWAKPFRDGGTKAFRTLTGAKVQAPMLTTSLDATYRHVGDWQSVTVPYAGDELAMTLIVPDQGKLASVEATLDANLLDLATTADAAPRTVRLTMPAFDLDSRPSLTGALKAVGLTDPLESHKDFGPMTADGRGDGLFLANMVHEATVQVDANGTTAAAATGANVAGSGAPGGDAVTLTIDRPFIFVIADRATRAPLFVGRVTDPTQP